MLKNILWVLLLLVVVVTLGGVYAKWQTTTTTSEVASVIGATVVFGESLHTVSLSSSQAPQDIARAYTAYVAPDLLAQWEQNPSLALGAKMAGPSPSGISIVSFKKQADGSYVLLGNIQDATTTYPVTLTFKKYNGTWLIASVERK